MPKASLLKRSGVQRASRHPQCTISENQTSEASTLVLQGSSTTGPGRLSTTHASPAIPEGTVLREVLSLCLRVCNTAEDCISTTGVDKSVVRQCIRQLRDEINHVWKGVV